MSVSKDTLSSEESQNLTKNFQTSFSKQLFEAKNDHQNIYYVAMLLYCELLIYGGGG